MLWAEKKWNLYVLGFDSFNQKTITNAFSLSILDKTDVVSLWNSRLGHPSGVVIKHVPFLKDKDCSDTVCEICPMVK